MNDREEWIDDLRRFLGKVVVHGGVKARRGGGPRFAPRTRRACFSSTDTPDSSGFIFWEQKKSSQKIHTLQHVFLCLFLPCCV